MHTVAETWLHDDIAFVDYFPVAYNVFHRDRDYKAVGQRNNREVLIVLNNAVPALRHFD